MSVRAEEGKVVSRPEECTAQIRSWIELLADGCERVPDLVAEAHRERYWSTLGYPDWETYVRTEFGTSLLRLSVAVRRDWVTRLTDGGLSRREIAPVVNVGTATVARDREAVSIDTPDLLAGFAIMPKLRWRLEGTKLTLDLTEYRAAVRDLAEIYPEHWRPAIIDHYELVLSGIEKVRSFQGIDLDKFNAITDKMIQEAAEDVGKLMRRC
jgi:hypothetical protein